MKRFLLMLFFCFIISEGFSLYEPDWDTELLSHPYGDYIKGLQYQLYKKNKTTCKCFSVSPERNWELFSGIKDVLDITVKKLCLETDVAVNNTEREKLDTYNLVKRNLKNYSFSKLIDLLPPIEKTLNSIYRKKILEYEVQLEEFESGKKHCYWVDREGKSRCIPSCKENIVKYQNYIDLAGNYFSRAGKTFFEKYQWDLSFCEEYHKNPKVFYERGLMNFCFGNIFDVLLDIEKLIESSENINAFLSKTYLLKGKSENELGLYNDAIKSLYEVLKKDPRNKEAYFERAQAYFELGEFDKAISDFLQTGLKSETIDPEDFSSLLFAKGLILGVLRGGKDGAVEFVPSSLASLQGLSHGLWALVTDPENCSNEIVTASLACIEFFRDSSCVEIIKGLVPELGELIENWTTISDEEKGNLMGYVIGKYGIDILITSGSIKAVQAYRNLKKANNLFTLERVSKNIKKGGIIKEASNALNKTNLETIRKIKAGEAFLKPYQGQYLPENAVRKILHQAEFKTFSKPKGIPADFRVKLSNGGGGMKYVHPSHADNYVRIMPGKPHSPNPCQQKPYAVQMKHGKAYDKYGNKVSTKAFEAHIPLEEFIYRSE